MGIMWINSLVGLIKYKTMMVVKWYNFLLMAAIFFIYMKLFKGLKTLTSEGRQEDGKHRCSEFAA